MMNEIDPRLVTLVIETSQGVMSFDQGYTIKAQGIRIAGNVNSETTIQIFNLKVETRDFLLSQLSPFSLNPAPSKVSLYVGRKSYGTFLIFTGQVVVSSPTQPPDIGITLKALNNFGNLAVLQSVSAAPLTTLKTIAAQLAAASNLTLKYEAMTVPNIANFTFNGSATDQLKLLSDLGNVDAYSDNMNLIVKDRGMPLKGSTRVLNMNTGMVGVPDVTQQGGRVKMFVDNTVEPGGSITIQSQVNPAANGTYYIYQLGFEIASRETPFYYLVNYQRSLAMIAASS